MAKFEQAHAIVMKHEGGYANSANDKGGETYKGVARKRHPGWLGWKIVDANKSLPDFPRNLDANESLQRHVLSFYKSEFWDILSLDSVNDQSIATELYDTGVNMGTGIAAIFLQTALNVTNRNEKDYADLKEDGRIGPKTIATLNGHKRPLEVLKVLNILQGSRYIAIMKRDPSQELWFGGWFARVAI